MYKVQVFEGGPAGLLKSLSVSKVGGWVEVCIPPNGIKTFLALF